MTDYKTMYYRLFNRITDLIDDLVILQQELEEDYISDPDTVDEAKIKKLEETLAVTKVITQSFPSRKA